jgi:hypothetical protein
MTMTGNHADIVAALGVYFDGFYEGDTGKLEQIFHPSCHLYGVTDGVLMDSDMEAVYARVNGRIKPSDRGDKREDGFLTLDQSGPDCAFAKVYIALGERMFTDYLTLILIDGRWQIITKTFTWVPREGVEPLA